MISVLYLVPGRAGLAVAGRFDVTLGVSMVRYTTFFLSVVPEML